MLRKTARSRSAILLGIQFPERSISIFWRSGISFIKNIDVTKRFRFLFPILTIAILSISMPSSGTIDVEEWNSPTPGGNEIGTCNSCPGKGLSIYRGTQAYVEEIRDFGFYDRTIIGRAAEGYFTFDEQTQQAIYFEDREQLCSQVLAANRPWNNTLRYFNGRYPIDYYALKYSLYVVFPFIVLFLIFLALVQPDLVLEKRIDRILKSKRFALSLPIVTAFCKYLVSEELVKATHPLDDIEDLFVAILYLMVFAIAWTIGWLSSHKIGLQSIPFPLLNSCLKVILYVGTLMLGLSLTVGFIQSPDTSIRFFSCELN